MEYIVENVVVVCVYRSELPIPMSELKKRIVMNPSSNVSLIHSLYDADEIAKKSNLPHFFKDKLRLTVLKSRSVKGEMLKTYAELFSVATKVARESRYNLVEIHKYSDMEVEEQVSRYKELALDHTGHMPNPVMLYALEYAAYKLHRREKQSLKKLKGAKV